MKLRLSSNSRVESDTGYHLIPAGLFKYKVWLASLNKHITFWSEFVDDEEERSILVTLNIPPCWDDGTEISSSIFKNILHIIGDGFLLKGYKTIFTSAISTSLSDSQMTSIFDTEGGKWLEEVSKNEDIADFERDILWNRALIEYTKANANNLVNLPSTSRPPPSQTSNINE